MIVTPSAIFVHVLDSMFFYVLFAMEEEEKWSTFLQEQTDDWGEEVNMSFDELDAVGMGCFSFPLTEGKNKRLARRLSEARGCQMVKARNEVAIRYTEVLSSWEEYPSEPTEWLEVRCNECRRRGWDDSCLACPNRQRLLAEQELHLSKNQITLLK